MFGCCCLCSCFVCVSIVVCVFVRCCMPLFVSVFVVGGGGADLGSCLIGVGMCMCRLIVLLVLSI